MRVSVICILFVLAGCSTASLSRRLPSADQEASGKPASKLRICYQYQNIFFISVNEKINLECEKFIHLDRSLGDMQSLRISKETPFLGSIIVNQFEGWNWGTENWFVGTIEYFIKPDDPSWSKASEFVFAHEVGHLFLQAYLADRDPLFAKLFEVQKKSFQYYKYFLPIILLKQDDPSCSDPTSACSRKIKSIIASSPVDLNGPSGDSLVADFRKENQAQIERFLEVMPAYHELFADLFQSIYFEDPNVNNSASRGIVLPLESCRTFGEKLTADFKSDDSHCSFSSIRYELWQKLVVPSFTNKRRILKKVADAIWAEVEPQLRSAGGKIDSSEAAKRLLNRILSGTR